MSEREARDPFSLTADTGLYVARPASERALEALLAALAEGGGAVALTGPAGLGKTLLLHVLAARASERWRAVYLPYSSLSPEDLTFWVLGTLGEGSDAQGREGLPALADRLHAAGDGLLLLVDDAGALPLETARWLAELAADPPGRLAVVVAASDHGHSGARLAALDAAATVRLSEPLDEHECQEYVRARLALADAPESLTARFSEASIRRLHSISCGNPRRLHIAASDLLNGGSGRVPEDLFGAEDELAIPLLDRALEGAGEDDGR